MQWEDPGIGPGLTSSPQEPRTAHGCHTGRHSPGAWASGAGEGVPAGGVWRVGHPVIPVVVSWDGVPGWMGRGMVC